MVLQCHVLALGQVKREWVLKRQIDVHQLLLTVLEYHFYWPFLFVIFHRLHLSALILMMVLSLLVPIFNDKIEQKFFFLNYFFLFSFNLFSSGFRANSRALVYIQIFQCQKMSTDLLKPFQFLDMIIYFFSS